MSDIQIFDEATETHGTIETTGDIFKPWIKQIGYLVNEARFEFSDDGITVHVVDRSNVSFIETTLHASAFESYDMSDVTLGVDIASITNAVRRARVNSEDELKLTITDNDIRAEVARPYDKFELVSADRVGVLDPASVREGPEVTWDLEYSVELPKNAYLDALKHALESEYVNYLSEDGSFAMSGGEDSGIVFDGVPTECPAEKTTFSGDYQKELFNMLKKSRANEVEINWGVDFPMQAHWKRVDNGEEIAEYTFGNAPRIRNE